jgi:GNAT superfamily N-acetyltransferase
MSQGSESGFTGNITEAFGAIKMATNSKPFNYDFVFELSQKRAEYVTNKVIEFNRPKHSPLWENPSYPRIPLEIYVLDEKGGIIGGLIGRTNQIPEWLEVSVIWVAEDQRKQGLGSHLMHLAETEAKKRGCHYARLATSDYQAPDFYHKVGYKLYGQLENCPRGETVYYFCKEL